MRIASHLSMSGTVMLLETLWIWYLSLT